MTKYIVAGLFMALGAVVTVAGTYAKGRLDQLKRDREFLANYRGNEG